MLFIDSPVSIAVELAIERTRIRLAVSPFLRYGLELTSVFEELSLLIKAIIADTKKLFTKACPVTKSLFIEEALWVWRR